MHYLLIQVNYCVMLIHVINVVLWDSTWFFKVCLYNSEINDTTKLILLKILSQQLTLRFYIEIGDFFFNWFIYLLTFVRTYLLLK